MGNATAFDWAGVVDYAKRSYSEPPKTQYELPGVNVEDHLGVPVACVPLWHAVVTARLTLQKGDKEALQRAQSRLSAALAEIESIYPLNPGGILTQVAYGLSYFKEYHSCGGDREVDAAGYRERQAGSLGVDRFHPVSQRSCGSGA